MIEVRGHIKATDRRSSCVPALQGPGSTCAPGRRRARQALSRADVLARRPVAETGVRVSRSMPGVSPTLSTRAASSAPSSAASRTAGWSRPASRRGSLARRTALVIASSPGRRLASEAAARRLRAMAAGIRTAVSAGVAVSTAGRAHCRISDRCRPLEVRAAGSCGTDRRARRFRCRQMAARARELLDSHDIVADCRRVTAPTLVVTGEAGLDRVVPVESTATYLELIRGRAERRAGAHRALSARSRVPRRSPTSCTSSSRPASCRTGVA